MYDAEILSEICEKADAAGKAAVEKAFIRPMLVGSEAGFMSGKIDYSKPVELVEDGVCGFAWVNVYPENKGTTTLGKMERKALEACGFRKSYEGKHYYLWIGAYNQSMQKKEAYANAYAEVLRQNGLKAYSGSRLD